MTNPEAFAQTERTVLKRLPKRGFYDRELVYQILDEGFICHVGFAFAGKPFVIPTGYARVENKLLIHGSQASRMLRALPGSGCRVHPVRRAGSAFVIFGLPAVSVYASFCRSS